VSRKTLPRTRPPLRGRRGRAGEPTGVPPV